MFDGYERIKSFELYDENGNFLDFSTGLNMGLNHVTRKEMILYTYCMTKEKRLDFKLNFIDLDNMINMGIGYRIGSGMGLDDLSDDLSDYDGGEIYS